MTLRPPIDALYQRVAGSTSGTPGILIQNDDVLFDLKRSWSSPDPSVHNLCFSKSSQFETCSYFSICHLRKLHHITIDVFLHLIDFNETATNIFTVKKTHSSFSLWFVFELKHRYLERMHIFSFSETVLQIGSSSFLSRCDLKPRISSRITRVSRLISSSEKTRIFGVNWVLKKLSNYSQKILQLHFRKCKTTIDFVVAILWSGFLHFV